MRLRRTEEDEDKGPGKTKGQRADGVSEGKKSGKKKTSALT